MNHISSSLPPCLPALRRDGEGQNREGVARRNTTFLHLCLSPTFLVSLTVFFYSLCQSLCPSWTECFITLNPLTWQSFQLQTAKERTNTFCICKLLTPLQMTIPSHLHKCCSHGESLWDYSIVKSQQCFGIWEAVCAKATKKNSVCI